MMTIIAENAAMETVRGIEKELDKYLYMRQLHHENPNLYYKLLINNAQELVPVVERPPCNPTTTVQIREHLSIDERMLHDRYTGGRCTIELRSFQASSIYTTIVILPQLLTYHS
ncbi:hypothetical protein R1flu_022027 [Riccia fluitans]|uniref:Uncharacterized protein n=1 Tax=Riccia fluitans TaxID=41844 RepID=A0ABD1ZU50_9MARC